MAREFMSPGDRQKAHDKSMELLAEWLSPEQAAELDSKGYFTVIGSESGIRYRIFSGVTTYNVVVLGGDGYPKYALCFAPYYQAPDSTVHPLPHGDMLLGQKLMIEHCEQEVSRVANLRPFFFNRAYEPLFVTVT